MTAPLIDLREHFGVWEHCPGSLFWRQVFEPHPGRPEIRVYINPVDGVIVRADENLASRGLAFDVVVKSGRQASEDDAEAVRERLVRSRPWVIETLDYFFAGLALATAVASRSEESRDLAALNFIQQTYWKPDDAFLRTGRGHRDPGLDELLAAAKVFLGELHTAVVSRKTVLSDDLPEVLEDHGIPEC